MIQKIAPSLIVITIVGYFLVGFFWNMIFTKSTENKVSIQEVGSISSAFTEPPADIFNDEAINITEIIRISGNEQNPTIFDTTEGESVLGDTEQATEQDEEQDTEQDEE